MEEITPQALAGELSEVTIDTTTRERAIESWFRLRSLHLKMDKLRHWLEPSELEAASEALEFARDQLRLAMLENDSLSGAALHPGASADTDAPGSPSGPGESFHPSIENRLVMAKALYTFVARKAVERMATGGR